jgi:tricorn protease-like protein
VQVLHAIGESYEKSSVESQQRFLSDKLLGVADADGSNSYHITNTVRYDYSPVWSPDGQWIAFWKDSDVYKIRPDGTDLTRLTFRDGTWDDYMEETGAWTTDGEWLITSAKVNTIDGLYAVATDGSGKLVPLSIRELACNDWVGSAGDVDFWEVFLPLILRNW